MTTPNTQTMIGGQLYDTSALDMRQADRVFRDAWQMDGTVVTVDWAKARANFRQTATLDRISFVLKAVEAGFLAEADAESAARGEWPPSFNDVLAAIPANQRLAAKVTWAGLTTVRRSADVLAVISAVKGISENDLDEMFGYAGQ